MTDWLKRVTAIYDKYGHIITQLESEKKRLTKAKKDLKDIEEAQQILQEIAQSIQESAHAQIASVVSKCLEVVFGEDAYEFKIFFEKKRGKTEARIAFFDKGKEIDPRGGSSGGQIDVAALALRVVSLMASPKKRRFICLDEPFKWVDAEHRVKIRELLVMLAKEFKIQFIMATHFQEFHFGKVIDLGEK